METNTIVMLCLLWLVVILAAFTSYISNKQSKEDAERLIIDGIQDPVKEDLEEIVEYAERFGDKYYDSLMDFAAKMEKLSESDVKADLKPYDVYNVKRLHEPQASGFSSLGRIVINKNLEPRFMVTPSSTIPSRADIQLEVALTTKEVKELADKCRKIKMDVDIETFRKDKVKKAINKK